MTNDFAMGSTESRYVFINEFEENYITTFLHLEVYFPKFKNNVLKTELQKFNSKVSDFLVTVTVNVN